MFDDATIVLPAVTDERLFVQPVDPWSEYPTVPELYTVWEAPTQRSIYLILTKIGE